jgi:hypothetical protein
LRFREDAAVSPNRKRETARIMIWTVAATTIIAAWAQTAWFQSG